MKVGTPAYQRVLQFQINTRLKRSHRAFFNVGVEPNFYSTDIWYVPERQKSNTNRSETGPYHRFILRDNPERKHEQTHPEEWNCPLIKANLHARYRVKYQHHCGCVSIHNGFLLGQRGQPCAHISGNPVNPNQHEAEMNQPNFGRCRQIEPIRGSNRCRYSSKGKSV